MQMVEKIAEKTHKAKISTKARVTELIKSDCACTGCIYEKGGANLKEFGPVIFDSGGFGADFTNNSLLVARKTSRSRSNTIRMQRPFPSLTVASDCSRLKLPFSVLGIPVLHETLSIDSLNAYVNVFMTTNTMRTFQLFQDFAAIDFKG